MIILSILLDVLSICFLSLYWKYSESLFITIIGIAVFIVFIAYLIMGAFTTQKDNASSILERFFQMLIIWLSIGVFCVNQNWMLYLWIIVVLLIFIKWLCVFKGNNIPNIKQKNFYDIWLWVIFSAFALVPIPGRMVMLWTILLVLTGAFIVYRAKLKGADITLIVKLLFWLAILYISNILELNIIANAVVMLYILNELSITEIFKKEICK